MTPDRPATQSLTTDLTGTAVTWLRGGTGPEVERVTFEVSTDGMAYVLKGEGRRIAGGWQLDGVFLPQGRSVFVRARGYYSSGAHNGSGAIVETVKSFYFAASAAP